jgi:hypothetical protein
MPVSDELGMGDRETECCVRRLTNLGPRWQIGTGNQIKARDPISLAMWHMYRLADAAACRDQAPACQLPRMAAAHGTDTGLAPQRRDAGLAPRRATQL